MKERINISREKEKDRRRGGCLSSHNIFYFVLFYSVFSFSFVVFFSSEYMYDLPNDEEAAKEAFIRIPNKSEDLLYGNDDTTKSYGDWWRGRDSNISLVQHHPYKGAKFNNMTGMIVDPSPARLEVFLDSTELIRNKLVSPEVLCPPANDYDVEGMGGNKVLQKIKAGILKSRKFIKNQSEGLEGQFGESLFKSSDRQTKRKSKVLCMVYTVHLPHDNHTNLRSQAHTWGKRCDGFFAASNYTDHSIGAIDLLHKGSEGYGNMWQKIRSMWTYAHQYYNEYDFFYICGDDVYVAVENLRAYVDGPEIERLENGYVDRILNRYKDRSKDWDTKRPRPLLLGTPIMHKDCPNPDGGSGYMMNRAALELFAAGLSNFAVNETDSREDMYVGGYFCEQGMFLADTQHAIDKGWRFSYGAEKSHSYKGGYRPFSPEDLKKRFGYEIPLGGDCVSEEQISFHFKLEEKRLTNHGYKTSDLMYRYEAIFYDWCEDS
jgi:glycoprotein-N-acetylgalactosamine 3-beta-galactosyltransferase